MAFGFFKDKSKGPLEVTCPLCEHTQQESPLAVSSYCKGCKAYLSFSKGGAIVARAQATPDPFAHRPAQPKVDIEYKAREEKAPISPAARKAAEAKTKAQAEAATKPEPAPKQPPTTAPKPIPTPTPTPQPASKIEAESSIKIPPVPVESQKPANSPTPQEEPPQKSPEPAKIAETETHQQDLAPRYHRQTSGDQDKDERSSKKKEANERLVACFECGDSHIANALANSTQCRQCGRLISLEDQHIRESWSSRIQTRGNVFIHKKGIVQGASIQCHNLIVEGDFTGSAECSGDLTLRRHGKIIGKVTCDRLLVEKRAKVEFLNEVEMNDCKIDGLVTGNLSCRGRLALEKKATLTGNIKVGTLTVADGAKHTGQIQMGAF